jgi:hypothetical protein
VLKSPYLEELREKTRAETDLAYLERMVDRLLTAASWSDLLATP